MERKKQSEKQEIIVAQPETAQIPDEKDESTSKKKKKKGIDLKKIVTSFTEIFIPDDID